MSFVNSIYSTFGGEPPSETSAGSWLECITDEIWNKARHKKHQCFLLWRAIWCRWIVWPLTCLLPQMPWWRVQMRKLFKMGFNKKTDTRTQALATCSGGPRCLMEWRRRLSNIKGHSTLDAIFTKFWRTERGSWQTSSLEAQNYKISLFKQFKSNFCCETSSC